ncbi:non-canonical purine NTP pyrophosphatase [bacterium]|jgi:XTP/dITP diphosphohydrolase|nr:non-canonical purine NTP pyrophosphatase [bacterium]MBT6832164.1 non-canonical purine NTP pyrophosphatase [bacterium]MBT6996390.1 non-canonical purine NTP pyrophosphatase [bacterium]MBT7772125.1 non-canonical purine NTP pyrophosphatase [bacterium]
MKILIATGNQGKKMELLEAFAAHGGLENLEILSLADFPEITDDVEETGKSFEENALLKAKFFGEKFNIPAIGEDSGLILDAFPEKFGIRTRREIPAATDELWLETFLKLLENVENRRATFFSATAFFDPNSGNSETFLGSTAGKITAKPESKLEPGIPVSAVFCADGETKVYSALQREQKNKISHRGKSVAQLHAFLKNLK